MKKGVHDGCASLRDIMEFQEKVFLKLESVEKEITKLKISIAGIAGGVSVAGTALTLLLGKLLHL